MYRRFVPLNPMTDQREVPKMSKISRRLRERRDRREFNRALENASPAMRQELEAAAVRQSFRIQ